MSQNNFIPTMFDDSSSSAGGHLLDEESSRMFMNMQDSHLPMLVNNQGPHMNMFEQQNEHMIVSNPTQIGEDNDMSGNENHDQVAAGEFDGDDEQGEDEYDEEEEEDGEEEEEEEEEEDGEGEEEEGYQDRSRRRKTNHRHTPQQIQELENFFTDCHRPNERQRKLLSHKLGMDLMQIKFWFQNKRTQMKTHMERTDNTRLKEENGTLKREAERVQTVISNVVCPQCGGHGIQEEIARLLQAENERSSAEVGGVANNEASGEQQPPRMPGGVNNSFSNPMLRAASAAVTPGRGIIPYSSGASTSIDRMHQQQQQQHLLQQLALRNFQIDKNMVWNMAIGAISEVEKLSQMGEPMWIPNNADSNTYQLNEEEYFRVFPLGFGPRPPTLHCEGTRHSTVLAMNSLSLVNIFMNLNHWKTIFNAIVARSMTLGVVSTGSTGSYSGALQVISTELQVLSHLVPIRQNILARYCRQLREGKWGIVDVSVDIFRPIHLVKCRKRPSGCIIEDMPNGFARVTWIEHVEVDELGVYPIFRPLVVSAYAFGAKRWLGILERQTDRLVSVYSQSLPFNDIVVTNMGSKRIMTRLAERMVANYNVGVGAAAGAPWKVVEHGGAVEMKILMLRNVDNPGRPIGVVLSTTVSFWLPAPPMSVFDYIRTLETRNEWDVLASGGRVEEVSRIVVGRDNANCISLIRISKTKMLILQEANWDPMGAYLIYAPVDVNAINLVMAGVGDSDYVALLPSGFVVLPDGPNDGSSDGGAGGSLITLSFQLLVDSSPAAENLQESFETVTNLIINTMNGLNNSFNNGRDALSLV